MALMDFNIDTSGTPQDVQRRQKLADALMQQGMDSAPAAGGPGGGWITALNRGLAGAVGGYQRASAANDERQGRAAWQQRMATALQGGKIDPTALVGLAADPWANPTAISAANTAYSAQHQAVRDAIADQHWAASYGLQKRAADRADDPTPDNFEANPDYGKVTGAPQYRPIPGGPADPTYIGSVTGAKEKAKVEAEGPGATFDDETISEMAKQARAGDTSVFTNIGRGAQGPQNLVRLRQEIVRQNKEAGTSGSEQALRNAEFFGVKAGQRTIGTKGANIEMAATEFNQVLPVVQEASKAVSRTNYPDLNKIIQAAQEKTGDPNIVKFGGGVNTLVNLYARAISPTGNPTVSDKEHAREILSRSWSNGQFDAAVGMMQQEIKAALSSPEQVRDEMRSRFLRGQGAAPVGYPAPGGNKSVESQGSGADAMLAQARDAIAKGAPRDKVIERLKGAGIDPSAL